MVLQAAICSCYIYKFKIELTRYSHMIPENHILDVIYKAALALKKSSEDRKSNLVDLDYQHGEGVPIFGDSSASAKDDIKQLIKLSLQKHSPLIPIYLSGDVILNHLGMLAPNLPIYLLPIVVSCLSGEGEINSVDQLLEKIEQAKQQNEIRNSPAVDSLRWEIGFDTHIGMKKALTGQTNQDAVYFNFYESSALVLVADGISVSTAGT